MDWTHSCGWGPVWGVGYGIADCRYAGGQLMWSTPLPGGPDAHECRSDAYIAILQTVDTTDCMAYCSADQSADIVTAQVTDCQCVLIRQC